MSTRLKPNLTISLAALSSSTILLFALPLTSTSNNECSYSKCSPIINFPFRTSDQPITCGLPGFDLLCNETKPVLPIPSRHGPINLTIESITYPSQLLKVTDSESCLPEKLIMLFDYFSTTPFYLANYTLFSVYNCSLSTLYSSLYSKIDCLSGPNYSVVCGRYDMHYPSYDSCELMGNVGGPGSYPYEFSGAKSAYLRWVLPDICLRCQTNGGECLRAGGNITCSKPLPSPSYNTDRYIDRTNNKVVIPIIFGIFGPIFLVMLGVICITIYNKTGSRNRTRNTTNFNDTNNIIMDQNRLNTNRQPPSTASGLEQGTLDTYPTIVVGESGRMLASMEDKSCPVCLSDFEPKETLKTLPECLHKFHGECIDEWLRAKALCPVCRTPPPRRSS